MNAKLLIITLLLLLTAISIFLINNSKPTSEIKERAISNNFQGPVPEGYDEDYFRRTGITRPLENNL